MKRARKKSIVRGAPVVRRSLLESTQGSGTSYPETFDNRLGMDFLSNQFLGFSEELRGKHADACCAVADLIILDLGNVNENLGCRIVELDRFEDCRAVVRNIDFAG